MPLTKIQKKEILDKITSLIKESQSLALINIDGIKNNDLIKLKTALRQSATNIKVVKKTLMAIAFKNAGFDSPPLESFKFSCALVPSKNDPSIIMKILNVFAKNVLKKNLIDIIAGGFVDKHYLDGKAFAQYAYLPSIDELYAKLAFSLTYPVRKLVMDLKFLSGLKLISALKILSQTKN